MASRSLDEERRDLLADVIRTSVAEIARAAFDSLLTYYQAVIAKAASLETAGAALADRVAALEAAYTNLNARVTAQEAKLP